MMKSVALGWAIVGLLCAALINPVPVAYAQIKIFTIEGPQTVVFDPGGKWIAAGLADGAIKIWDVESGSLIRAIAAHEKFVYGLAVSRDGRRLASGGADKLVKLWNPATGEAIQTLEGHAGGVRAVAFSPDGSRLVSGDQDAVVKSWEVETGRQVFSVGKTGGINAIHSLTFNQAGDWVATGQFGLIRILDAATGALVQDRAGLVASINGLTVSPDGMFLAAAVYSGSVLITDSRTGTQPRTLSHGSSTAAVAYSPDGSLLASAGGSGEVKLWDTKTWRARRVSIKHKEPVFSIAFSPDGKLIASASNDKTVKLWDVSTGKEIRSINVP